MLTFSVAYWEIQDIAALSEIAAVIDSKVKIVSVSVYFSRNLKSNYLSFTEKTEINWIKTGFFPCYFNTVFIRIYNGRGSFLE